MEEEIKKIVREEIARNTHTIPADEILNSTEAADFLKVKRSTIYDLKARGKIPYKLIGGKIIFFKNELIEWVKSGKAAD